MNTSHIQAAVPTSKKRRRFAILFLTFIAAVGLGLHLPVAGLSSNSASTSPTGPIFMLSGAQASSAPSALTSTVFGSTATTSGKVVATSPGWSPMVDYAGQVTTAGDIAIVDASSATSALSVTLHVINLAALSHDYASFTLPVAVYYASTGLAGSAPMTGSCSTVSGCNWQLANGEESAPNVASDTSYLANEGGSVTFQLPPGAYYEIAMPTGGSYYCISTMVSNTASLSPLFFVNSVTN